MQTRLRTWNDFERRIHVLERWLRRITTPDNRLNKYWLYGGQANSSWQLATTLERAAGPDVDLKRYYQVVTRAKPEIESLTNQQWEIPTPPKYSERADEAESLPRIPEPAYEYLVYLRHHGFPSPLLNWTRSPFVAAYFAIKDAKPTEDVASYAYHEYG